MENINNNYIPNVQEEDSTLSLKDIWGIIWGYKWWYVASVVVCLFAVSVYLYRTPEIYQRTAKVIIDETEQSSTLRNLTQLTGGMTGLRANAQVANEMEAFRSPDLMQKVVERLHLETKYYEDQFLRSVEYYQNSPVELRLVEGNPQNSFSFTVVNLGNDKILLKDFVIGPDEVKETVEAVLGQPANTPAGVLNIIPTMFIDDFQNYINVSWSSSMGRAKAICEDLSVSLSSKESTVVVLSIEVVIKKSIYSFFMPR